MEHTEGENYFLDPFGNLNLKIFATVAYIAGLPCCFVALCFIWYETSGRAGPYRTCINQLVSRIYLLVSLFRMLQFLEIIGNFVSGCILLFIY